MIEKIFAFIMGTIVGSFLNVCIYRMQRSESIVTPPSHCPNCKAPIAWHDNIPVISYLILTGRCRSCRKPISPRYILVELLTGALFLALLAAFGVSPKLFSYMIFVSALITVTFIDFDTETIPDHITFPGIAAGMIAAVAFPSVMGELARVWSFAASAGGALAGAGLIYFVAILGKLAFKKDAMGEGDILLMAMIGAFLGWKLVILTFFISPMFGAVAGVIIRMKTGEDTIPYGPYLSLGALVSLFFGDRILGYLFYGLR